jgi:multiple sugar transport system permease protein
MKVLSVGMTTFRLQQTVQWNLLNAGVIISLVPILIIFFFAQKFFIRGITFTGLK